MGTTAITAVKHNGRVILRTFHQCDGYPGFTGKLIADALSDRKLMTNGYTDPLTQVNGLTNAAAFLAYAFMAPRLKDNQLQCGGVYVVDPNKRDNEAYNYTVYEYKGAIFVRCFGLQNYKFFDGCVANFAEFCDEFEG